MEEGQQQKQAEVDTTSREWKDFMPPDDFVPEWKKQFLAMEREVKLKKLADRALFVMLGFATSTGLSFVPHPKILFVNLGVTVVLLLVAAVSAFQALRLKLKAVEIDNKLNESVRIEPDKAVQATDLQRE